MDTIRWDAMAALIALIGLPFMLSGSATWLIKLMFRRIQRCILAHGSTCERLEWQDIPDGALQEGLPAVTKFDHNDKDCLASSFGKIFQMAWISAQRRNIRVFKPYSLDPTKHYIRTDRKALEAFVLLSGASIIEFRDINGILTAHIPVHGSEHWLIGGELHNRTKHEVEMILQGYPPCYLQKIRVTNTTTVSSPICSVIDTTRGGWILGVGLDFLMTPPLSTQNMEDGYGPPSHWKITKRRNETEPWLSTCMSYAIERFGQVLDKLLVLFPEDATVKDAAAIFRYLVAGGFNYRRSRPFYFLEYADFEALIPYSYAYLDRIRNGWVGRDGESRHEPGYYSSLPFRRANLNEDEWQLAMTAFNHSGPLSPVEVELFRNRLCPILQAGIFGLVCVFMWSYSLRCLKKLPNYPELKGRKYVYLTQCEPGLED